MKVQVRLFAALAQHVPDSIRAHYPKGIHAGVPLEVELPEQSTLSDLVSLLGLPQDLVRVIFVNGRARSLDYGLSPGDEVGIFPPIGGG